MLARDERKPFKKDLCYLCTTDPCVTSIGLCIGPAFGAQDSLGCIGAFIADDDANSACADVAVIELVRRSCACVAESQDLCIFTKINFESAIKHVQRSFPEPVILKGLAIAHDTAVHLVHLIEPAVLHEN